MKIGRNLEMGTKKEDGGEHCDTEEETERDGGKRGRSEE